MSKRNKMSKKKKKELGYAIGIIAILIVAYLFSHATLSIALPSGLSVTPAFQLITLLPNPQQTPQQLFSITGAQPTNISYVGSPLTQTFNLPINETSGQSGNTYTYVECATFVTYNSTISSALTLEKNTTPEILTVSPYTSSITYTPQNTGIYTFAATCESSVSTYDPTTNTWSPWTPWSVLSPQQINVITVENKASPPAPQPFSFTQILSSFLTALSNFLKSVGL